MNAPTYELSDSGLLVPISYARLEAKRRERVEQRAEWRWRSESERAEFVDQFGAPRIRGGSVAAAYRVATATVFAAPAAVHTFLMAISPAGHGLAMTEFAISFDGVTASAVPVLVELVTSTQAGAGTSGVTPTITQVRGRGTGGSPPTGGSNYTAEPTTLVRVGIFYVPAFMGQLIYQFPLGREIECDSSAGTIKALGIRITPPAIVNAVGHIEVEALG